MCRSVTYQYILAPICQVCAVVTESQAVSLGAVLASLPRASPDHRPSCRRHSQCCLLRVVPSPSVPVFPLDLTPPLPLRLQTPDQTLKGLGPFQPAPSCCCRHLSILLAVSRVIDCASSIAGVLSRIAKVPSVVSLSDVLVLPQFVRRWLLEDAGMPVSTTRLNLDGSRYLEHNGDIL
jgi:hypothetical protein